MKHDLFRAAADAVHLCDPGHLIGSFERFGHALAPGHLHDEQLHPLFTGLVDFQKVRIQLPGQQQFEKSKGCSSFR